MKYLCWGLVALLLVLHQDYWQWLDDTLDFGFLPRGLSYHAGLSLAAAVVWMLTIHYCWPSSAEPNAPGVGAAPSSSDSSDPNHRDGGR